MVSCESEGEQSRVQGQEVKAAERVVGQGLIWNDNGVYNGRHFGFGALRMAGVIYPGCILGIWLIR